MPAEVTHIHTCITPCYIADVAHIAHITVVKILVGCMHLDQGLVFKYIVITSYLHRAHRSPLREQSLKLTASVAQLNTLSSQDCWNPLVNRAPSSRKVLIRWSSSTPSSTAMSSKMV
jgi:hypothetical protein